MSATPESSVSTYQGQNGEKDSLPDVNLHDESQDNGVKRVVSQLLQKAGTLGPLENPYDLEKVVSHPQADSPVNELDPWKYKIDKDTQFRLVQFVPDDKLNPKNKSKLIRWMYTFCLGTMCFTVALGSAIVTGDMERPLETFHISEEVLILSTVTVFVIGFGVGPLLFAPLSEEFGRSVIYHSTLIPALIFIIPCGLAQNFYTLLICRLIDGILFSAPMTLIGGSLADIWEAKDRGQAMAIFSAAPYMGPVMGPIVGGLLADYAPTWRWIYWTFLIIAGVVYLSFLILLPETHALTLLKRRAKMLRKTTGDDSYRAICELEKVKLGVIVKRSVLRPFLLLQELIVLLITVYMSITYGLLYMFFFAYPIVYMEGKGWSASKTGVMFIPIGVGVITATLLAPMINKDYNRRAQPYRDRGELPPPELRLYPMMWFCWFIPAGLFAFAWSSYKDISWAGPCFSGLAAGFGFCAIYNPGNNYLVDSYQHYAASALAAKTFVRSMWGAAVPLFTIQMYHKLDDQWATSVMAFISLACCAIPFNFFFFGARIRKYSKYAYSEN